MAKRILNMVPQELINLTKDEFLSAIAGSEGRAYRCYKCRVCSFYGGRFNTFKYV